MNSKNPNLLPKGYHKRPLWQWVIAYLILAAIIYGFIYYFFSGSNLIDQYSY